MDMFINHPAWQDHTAMRDLGRVIDTTVMEDDPRGTGRAMLLDDYSEPASDETVSIGKERVEQLYKDEYFVRQLLKAIQSNQVQLIPRTGNSGAYQQLIAHLGQRAKEME